MDTWERCVAQDTDLVLTFLDSKTRKPAAKSKTSSMLYAKVMVAWDFATRWGLRWLPEAQDLLQWHFPTDGCPA